MILSVIIPPVTIPAVIAASPFVHHCGAPSVHHPRGVVPKIAIVASTIVAVAVVTSTVVGAAIVGPPIVAAVAVVPIVIFGILTRLGHQRA
jgi:hypothetical protein